MNHKIIQEIKAEKNFVHHYIICTPKFLLMDKNYRVEKIVSSNHSNRKFFRNLILNLKIPNWKVKKYICKKRGIKELQHFFIWLYILHDISLNGNKFVCFVNHRQCVSCFMKNFLRDDPLILINARMMLCKDVNVENKIAISCISSAVLLMWKLITMYCK